MYISKIIISNIRCFGDFCIDFEEHGTLTLWTMITGDNAVGKTCLLRCIALGLCDAASAAALMKELKGQFLRQNAPLVKGMKKGFIEITLKKEGSNKVYKITTKIKKRSIYSPETLSQETEPIRNFPWKDIFICGYGPHRALFADTSQEDYIPLEAVYTMFNNEAHLQSPELILQRQNKEVRENLSNKLLNILMLDQYKKKVKFTKKGMEIPGPWGNLPSEVLSDGYRSTANWVTDFFGWLIYADKMRKGDEKISGILLIDELEQHLHPKWQRYIIQRLKNQFPKVQFITTTHSALVTVGVSDIVNAVIYNLKQSQSKKIIKEEIQVERLKGMRTDQVLTSDAFGLPIARSGDTGDKMVRFRELFLKKYLSYSEQKEYKKLKKSIQYDIPETGEMEEDRKVQRELRELLLGFKSELNLKNKKND